MTLPVDSDPPAISSDSSVLAGHKALELIPSKPSERKEIKWLVFRPRSSVFV